MSSQAQGQGGDVFPGIALGHSLDALVGTDGAGLGDAQLLRVKALGLVLHGAYPLWRQARGRPAAEHAVEQADVAAQGPQQHRGLHAFGAQGLDNVHDALAVALRGGLGEVE